MGMPEGYEGTIAEVPDGINPFVGIRGWGVNSHHLVGPDPWLTSVFKFSIPWPTDERLEADCIAPSTVWNIFASKYYKDDADAEQVRPEPHAPPHSDCTCGIYALNSPLHMNEPRPWNTVSIIGITLMWGRVLVGDRGYRSQYAKIAALWLDSKEAERVKLINRMADLYSVPVIIDLPGEFERQRSLQGGTLY